jgi:predicted dehydrogenase
MGVIGLGRRGWYHLERFRLREDVVVAGVTDPAAELRDQARKSPWPVMETVEALLAVKPLDAVLVAGPPTERDAIIPRALQAGLHVWVEPPLAADVTQARQWLSLAERCRRGLAQVPWARWDPEFNSVLAANASGRLGTVHTLRLAIAEWTPLASPDKPMSAATELPEQQFGPHGFDQLLQLVPANPTKVWARRWPPEDGFLAVIEFANGVTAQIDFRRRSRTGQSTGWMLEGTAGSYRGGRVFTVSSDGELIDEPVPHQLAPSVDEWRVATDPQSAPRREAEQRRAWQTVALIRAVTVACERGTPVYWDELVGS